MEFLSNRPRKMWQMMIGTILLFISTLNAQSNSQTAQSTQNVDLTNNPITFAPPQFGIFSRI